MTPEQVKLVQQSFATGRADRQHGGRPLLRPIVLDRARRAVAVSGDLTEQKKKLMQMIAVAVANLHQVEKIVPAVEDLGRRHAGYGVAAKHYEPVGAALLWTLEQGLGADFTPPVKAAWTETYLTVAGVMQKAAATVRSPADAAVATGAPS